MQTELIRQLNQVLNAFPEYWNNEKLQRTQVINDIKERKLDLIKALINNAKIKALYSTEIDGVLVFDFHALTNLLQYKEYWADSFTKYRNSVGLTSEGKYLNYNSDVALDFPFKDCVLEGGMTREEQGKDEIYYNEIIARDEIDRLFSPKVLTNVKRYSKNGVEENITDFSNEDNLIIKGNNLIALHSLKKRYAGKVKLIYIDPPYNTENDGFKYNDRFNHSTWLVFMKNRLEIAKELLSDDGIIFIQCDDNEQAYLKILLDSIFNENNFISTIVIKMSHLSGVKMSHRDKNIPKIKEYILAYSKNKTLLSLNECYQDANWDDVLSRYNSFLVVNEHNPNDYSQWTVISVKEAMSMNSVDENNKVDIENFKINNANKIFRTARNSSNQVMNLPKEKCFTKIITPTGLAKFIYNQEEVIFASNVIKNGKIGIPIGDIWSDIGINNLHNEGHFDFKNGKKPEKLIQRIIQLGSNEQDIILDFHLGSGTTVAIAHKMGRRYIGVEQMDYINDITVPRLQKVIEGEQGGISKDVNWQGGGSFVYTELKELNYTYIHQIQSAKSYDELAKLFEVIIQKAHLNYQVELDKILNDTYEVNGIDELVTFKDLTFDEQKHLLIELLDKNQLYVNADDMNDINLKVSEQDKAFTRSFYGKGE